MSHTIVSIRREFLLLQNLFHWYLVIDTFCSVIIYVTADLTIPSMYGEHTLLGIDIPFPL